MIAIKMQLPTTLNTKLLRNDPVVCLLTHLLLTRPQEFLMSGSAVCVSWDFNLHDWTDSGCKTTVGKNGNVTCSCNHLTNFAVLMVSQRYLVIHYYNRAFL